MDNALEEIAPNEKAAAPPPQRLIEFVLPMVIVAVDQATKAMVRASVPIHDSVTVIPGFFNITHALNSGAAFGILDGASFPYKTVVIAVIATAALIVGGAAGNLIDRVLAGSVVDFADFYLGTHHFWAFNVADSAISVGVTMLILDMLITGPHVPKTV